MEIILNRKVVFEEQSKELWGAYPWYKFLTKDEIKRYENDDEGIDVYPDSYTNAESKDIPIEWMKKLIEKAEKAGANYIQIDYHCDHEEYDIYGSLITRKSDEEVEKYKKDKSVSEKMKVLGYIRALEVELEKLKKSI